jgi:hypothetical protein
MLGSNKFDPVTLTFDLENQYGSRESGTLLIFKVKGQGHWVNFLTV